jgi:hypothetical protein
MQANPKLKSKTLPGATIMIVVGYALAAAGLVGLLSFNGSSDMPQLVQAGIYALIVIGILLSVAGILKLRSEFDGTQARVRNGLLMQGLALIVLLLGVVPSVVSSSLSGNLVSTAFLVISGIVSLAGILTLRNNYNSDGTLEHKKIDYLLLGTLLIWTGVGLIIASDVASYYMISQLENTVYSDIGATISAYGCVVSAYAFLNFHRHLTR